MYEFIVKLSVNTVFDKNVVVVSAVDVSNAFGGYWRSNISYPLLIIKLSVIVPPVNCKYLDDKLIPASCKLEDALMVLPEKVAADTLVADIVVDVNGPDKIPPVKGRKSDNVEVIFYIFRYNLYYLIHLNYSLD